MKTIPKKKKCKKGKWLSEAVKRRSKRQRRKGKVYPSKCRVPKNSRTDKKAFPSEQCK